MENKYFSDYINNILQENTSLGHKVGTIISVNNKMQKGYKYEIVRPYGALSDLEKEHGVEFKPHLTPQQMLNLGVFGGKYFNDVVATNEYPKSWWKNAKLSGLENERDINLNYFKIDASSSLAEWRQKGWIDKEDPRGWFEWYCRVYMGRRIPEIDKKQIGRFNAYVRHWKAVEKGCTKGDNECRLKQKQSLLHWAYDSRKL